MCSLDMWNLKILSGVILNPSIQSEVQRQVCLSVNIAIIREEETSQEIMVNGAFVLAFSTRLPYTEVDDK